MKTNHRKPYKIRNKYARSLREDPQFKPKVIRQARLDKPKKITVHEATRIRREEE